MKILVLGDIVGRPGRNFLSQYLQTFIEQEDISLCIANGENAAGGAGITAKTANEIKKSGVDALPLVTMYGIKKTSKMKSINWISSVDLQTYPSQTQGKIILC
jgi:calcineurin-like phosphoesterase